MAWFDFFSSYVKTAPETLSAAHQSMVDMMTAVACADGEVTPDEYNVVVANVQQFLGVDEARAQYVVERSFEALDEATGTGALLARLSQVDLNERERSAVYMSGYAVGLLGDQGEESSERALLDQIAERLELDGATTGELERQCRQALETLG